MLSDEYVVLPLLTVNAAEVPLNELYVIDVRVVGTVTLVRAAHPLNESRRI